MVRAGTLRRNAALRGQTVCSRTEAELLTRGMGDGRMEPPEQWIEILLVENNPADIKLLQVCLHDVTFPYHLSTVSNGEAAVAFLQRQAPYRRAPRPDLILLDIHLPKRSGWDVLAWVRAQRRLSSLPVVMLTGVFSLLDEERVEQLQPTRCLLKPREPGDYLRVGKALERVISQNPSAVSFCGGVTQSA